MMKKNTTNITYSQAKNVSSKADILEANKNKVQFCKKMTSDEAKSASEELTRRELEKLKRPRLEEPSFTIVDNQQKPFTYGSDPLNMNNNQIEINNLEMLLTYDAVQQLVVSFKGDMLQALSISVDYVDADGD